ncbi:pantetheine-phosphate adenylyltransferase [Canibacter sp. lx-45]|uniref:pantetheine-phosphate adenylyltransferase n=1 Tax=Canibacter zhuwentaonis TaxID=2837491 RepID=UPI001BDCBF03|nr:pantetheine-phosphate adenylyltransferase [Canibacter zhuwentaonis]
MSLTAVVPGSFDPLTLGHLDVVRRASKIFDTVHVLVVTNPDKKSMLDIATRERLTAAAIADAGLQNRVLVRNWESGLLVDYCKKIGASVLVKGVRSQTDVAYEVPMVLMNRSLADIETVFLLPNPAYSMVSSSLVRQVHALGGDVREYVPESVLQYLQRVRAADQ